MLVVKMGLALPYAECFHNNSEIIKTPMLKLTATQSYQKTVIESGLPRQNDLTNFLLGKQKIKCRLCTFPFVKQICNKLQPVPVTMSFPWYTNFCIIKSLFVFHEQSVIMLGKLTGACVLSINSHRMLRCHPTGC